MTASASRCQLAIQAIPNAPRNQLVSWVGEVLKVKIHAPALDGKANVELCSFLADTLGLPKRAVQLFRGDKARQKLVEIDGLTLAEVKQRLSF